MNTTLPFQSRLPKAAVAGSILLHLLMCVPFFLPGKTMHLNQVTYVDLTMPETAAPPSIEPQTRPAEPVEVAEEPVVRDEMAEVEEEPEKVAPQPEVAEQVQVQAQKPVQDDFVLGMMRGFFNTLANGRTLQPDLKDYYLGMLAKVNEEWWGVEADHRKIRSEVMAVVVIARNGILVDGRIVRSSGDPILDDLVLRTIRDAAPYPPLPETFPQDFFQAPIRLVPPLNLRLFDQAS